MHGYELRKRLSGALGHFWSISFGSLYPTLKRLEAAKAIEKAYTVKEKARSRNVYRITDAGEDLFAKLLTEPGPASDITDPDRFNLRMAFFRYMEPESRLWLLERRRAFLQDRLEEMNRSSWSGREKEADKYRLGLTRHRIEQTESDIAWLSEMIENEREQVVSEAGKKTATRKRKRRKEEGAINLVVEEAEGRAVPSKA